MRNDPEIIRNQARHSSARQVYHSAEQKPREWPGQADGDALCMRNVLLIPPRSQSTHRIEQNLRRHTERPNYQRVSEFVNEYGHENDRQPFDQERRLRETAVSE